MNTRQIFTVILVVVLALGIVVLASVRGEALTLLNEARATLMAQDGLQTNANAALISANQTITVLDSDRSLLATEMSSATEQASQYLVELTAAAETRSAMQSDILARQRGDAATAQVAAVATARALVGATARAEGETRGFTEAAATLIPEVQNLAATVTAVVNLLPETLATARAEALAVLQVTATAAAEDAQGTISVLAAELNFARTAQPAAIATAGEAGRQDGLRVAAGTLMPAFLHIEMTATAAAQSAEGTLAAAVDAVSLAATGADSRVAEAVATALNEGYFIGQLEIVAALTAAPTATPTITASPTPSATATTTSTNTPTSTASASPTITPTASPDVEQTVLVATVTAQAEQIASLSAAAAVTDEELRRAISEARVQGLQDALATLEPGVGTLQAQAGDNMATAIAAVDASVRSEAQIRAESTLRPAYQATITSLETAAVALLQRADEQATFSAQLIATVVSQQDAATRSAITPTMTITPTQPAATSTPIPLMTATSPPTLTAIPFLTATPQATATVADAEVSIRQTATAIAQQIFGTPTAATAAETIMPEVTPRDALIEIPATTLIYDQPFGFGQESSGWYTGRVIGAGTVTMQANRYALSAFAGQSMIITNPPEISSAYLEADTDLTLCGAGAQAGIAFRMTPDDGGYLFTVNCTLTTWQIVRVDGETRTLLASDEINRELLPFTGRHMLGTLGTADHLTFFVDGVEIASIKDDHFTSGYIGFTITASANSDATVRFYRIAVWEIVAEEGE